MQSEPGLLAQAWGRRTRTWELIRDGLSSRAAPGIIILIALLLTSTSLALGLSVDEYFERVALREDSNLPVMKRAPWDLFTFSTGHEMNQQLLEDGIIPWWTDPDFAISFFRPLTSLTLWLDHSWWPDNAALMHLHSMLWFALLLCCVSAVYREFFGSARLAALALLLYAVDDARAFPVGWIALRNALIALAPAFLALVAHHRWRSGRGAAYAWLGPLSLLVGLLGGEMAITVCGYLFAYAVFMDRGSLWARARTLLPYAAVVVGYRAVYNALGHGTLNSGLYFDPIREPLAFAEGLATRLPVLLLSQFALPPADLWELYPMFASWLRPAAFVFTLICLCVLALLFKPLLRSSRTTCFWALGCVLSTIPVCGTFPEDRLLTATSLGGAALLATALLALCEKTYPNPRRWTHALAGLLWIIHAVFAPLLLTVRARDIEVMEGWLERADQSIARGPEIRDKTLVVVNPPLSLLTIFFTLFREAKGIALPQRFRWLATGESDLYVERLDEHTLKLRPAQGFLASPTQRMFRSADRTFKLGERASVSDLSFEVTRVTADGRPAEVLARFVKNIDDPSLLWVQWGKHEYVRFRPPPVGASLVLPGIDPLSLVSEAPEKPH